MTLRIVGGSLKGRRLLGPAAGHALRPTADRARQALFDILAHGGYGAEGGDVLAGAAVLDAFCGTGALAFEALSRGAARAVLMDRAADALAVARGNAEALGLRDRATVLRSDATRPPPATAGPASLCFLDPPYGQGLVALALEGLRRAGWIGAGTLCVVETGRDEAPPQGLAILDERLYGAARILFARL